MINNHKLNNVAHLCKYRRRVFVQAFIPVHSSLPANVQTSAHPEKKTHCGKAKHRKPFVVIYLIICSSPSKWFCTGPRGCAGEHSLHYLAGQSLSSPCVFGPEDSVRLKISPQVRALFSLISDISEYANLFSDARFCWKGIIVY